MITEERLQQIFDRHEFLEHLLSHPDEMEGHDFAAVSKEYSDLGPVVSSARALLGTRAAFFEAAEIYGDPDGDAEMKELAEEEMRAAKAALPEVERALALMMLTKDTADARPAILEIRAGTGGDEAALFAGDLYRMYERFANLEGWRMELISSSPSEVGGFKEIVAHVAGQGVFAKLKFESGVHRVQRVPTTESGGRIHTSAATVAVLPEPEEVDIVLEGKDLRIDTYRSSGAGGQHVNTTDSAVRITHLPTGIVVTQQDQSSQHKNKDKAMQILRARLYDHEREKVETERADARKDQVGSGDRSERIRTYNFPQGRVTDHRIGLTLHKLEQILAGDGLSDVIEALIVEDQARKLAALEDDG